MKCVSCTSSCFHFYIFFTLIVFIDLYISMSLYIYCFEHVVKNPASLAPTHPWWWPTGDSDSTDSQDKVKTGPAVQFHTQVLMAMWQWWHHAQNLKDATKKLTGVYAGVGGGDTELRFDKFGNEGDEGGDDSALCRVGQTDKQEGHVAEDPQRCLGEVWGSDTRQDRSLHYSGAVINTQSVS